MKINNVINHIHKKGWIGVGQVVYLKYMLIKEDEIKISNFIGLCIAKKNKSNSLLIKNNIKKEDIKLLVHAHSPLIVSFKILKRYRKKYRLNKLYYK
jgi:ribosomal protein L19